MDDAVPAIYETFSNDTALLHNDPGNIARKRVIYEHYKPLTDARHPIVCDIAVFYPVEGEQWQCLAKPNEDSGSDEDFSEIRESIPRKPIDTFADACAELRRHCDFEVTDSLMIADGFLERIRTFVIPAAVPVPRETAERIAEWIRVGQGRLLWLTTAEPVILDGREPWSAFARSQGLPESGVERWPEFDPYATLRANHGANSFFTLHGEGCVSRFDPAQGEISILC
jgi:hypothetical protein